MDYCGECVSELPNNDAKFCPDLGYKRPVGTTPVEKTILQSASPLLTGDAHSPELQVKTNGIVSILLGLGVLVVLIGMMMAVASIIIMFVS